MKTSLPIHIKRHGGVHDEQITATRDALKNLLSTRNISPLSKELLERTMRQCQDALGRNEKDDVFNQLKEQIIYQQTWLTEKVKKDEKHQEDRKSLQDLLMKMFLFRYGDYLGYRCTAIRNLAFELKGKEAGKFKGRFWTEIFEDLKEEENAYISKKSKSRPMRDILVTVSLELKIPYQEVFGTIEEYCNRNLNGHESRVNEYIQCRSWNKLAEAIARDEKDLPSLLPPEYSEKQSLFSTAIQSIKDQYFMLINPKFDEELDGALESWEYLLVPAIAEEEMQLFKEKKEREEETKKAQLRAEELENRKGKKLKLDMELKQKMKLLNEKFKQMSAKEAKMKKEMKDVGLAHAKSVEDLTTISKEREELIDEAWKRMV